MHVPLSEILLVSHSPPSVESNITLLAGTPFLLLAIPLHLILLVGFNKSNINLSGVVWTVVDDLRTCLFLLAEDLVPRDDNLLIQSDDENICDASTLSE